MEDTERVLPQKMLVVADKEHFTRQLLEGLATRSGIDFLVPALHFEHVKVTLKSMSYQRRSAGYAIAETSYRFAGGQVPFRLLSQRTDERRQDDQYQGFVTTSGKDPVKLLCRDYVERWSVEEFFRFENKMGLNRAGTLNLHIRYGKLALAMIAQTATYQLRQTQDSPYR